AVHAKRRLMENNVHAGKSSLPETRVSNVSGNKIDISVRAGPGEIGLPPARQIIHHAHPRLFLDQRIDQMRSHKSGASCDEGCTSLKLKRIHFRLFYLINLYASL